MRIHCVTRRLLAVWCLAGLLCAARAIASAPEPTPGWTEIHGDGVYTVAQHDSAKKKLAGIEADFQRGMVPVAERANTAMRAIFRVAVLNLKRNGHTELAKEVEQGWRALDGELIRLAREAEASDRPITDFEPWSQKLGVLYLMIETALGYQLAYTLRITDLATYIWTPVVVFQPCRYGHTEFMYHFAHNDPRYRSFFPTTVYWVSTVTCSIGTFGLGIFWLCSPAAMLLEFAADRLVAERLGDFLYTRACE